MDQDNLVIKLCLRGTETEFKCEIDKVHAFYQQAWEVAQDDFDACVAAHYVAR
jgi:hypothetical protein